MGGLRQVPLVNRGPQDKLPVRGLAHGGNKRWAALRRLGKGFYIVWPLINQINCSTDGGTIMKHIMKDCSGIGLRLFATLPEQKQKQATAAVAPPAAAAADR